MMLRIYIFLNFKVEVKNFKYLLARLFGGSSQDLRTIMSLLAIEEHFFSRKIYKIFVKYCRDKRNIN